MRQKIVAGNWKMNLTHKEAMALCEEVDHMTIGSGIQVVIFPPSLFLSDCLSRANQVLVGAQNAYFKDSGAYTGEVSMMQVSDLGAKAVLIGHSERRMYFNETNDVLRQKVDAALAHQLIPYFCCGEPLEVREDGSYFSFVKKQLEDSIFHLTAEQFKQLVIAYEPIWAIGTGKTASAEQAEEMHAAIRSWIAERYSSEVAALVSILYGGSCNPGNAKSLFACPNVDGGLIGGAALKASDFSVLVAEETWTI